MGYTRLRFLFIKILCSTRFIFVLDGHIFLESFSSVYRHAHDFLIAIAEVFRRLKKM
jgi:hypothetical protein